MSAGTSSGRAQSALIVPVPAAEPAVAAWRELYDPVAVAGVPAHITLIVPWLPPAEIGDADLRELAAVLAPTPSWSFELRRTGWFGRRVLWLAPEPSEPFRVLTNTLAAHFGTPPWEDEFDEVVPHLTVAHASGDGVELAPVGEALDGVVPLRATASEVVVMCGDGARWAVRARVGLDGRGLQTPAGTGPGGRVVRSAQAVSAARMTFNSSPGPVGTL
jgi:2'-5' RNA ligase